MHVNGRSNGAQSAVLPSIRSVKNGRIVHPERLDLAPPLAAQRNLHDLVRINRWFGGHRSLLQVLRQFVRPSDRFSVLDVGAASGDMGQRVRRIYNNALVVSLDHRMAHLFPAAAPRVVAEAAALPFRGRSFDFVFCSSLLHHYSDECAVALVRELLRFPRQALIVLDLERHPIAYSFLPLSRWLFGWSEVTVHDGCTSVAAAFKAAELERIGEKAAASKVVVRNHRPWFRISAVISP